MKEEDALVVKLWGTYLRNQGLSHFVQGGGWRKRGFTQSVLYHFGGLRPHMINQPQIKSRGLLSYFGERT